MLKQKYNISRSLFRGLGKPQRAAESRVPFPRLDRLEGASDVLQHLGVDPGSRRAGKLHRARPRLCRRRFLQPNTCWRALDEIYTLHSGLNFSSLNCVQSFAEVLPRKILSIPSRARGQQRGNRVLHVRPLAEVRDEVAGPRPRVVAASRTGGSGGGRVARGL